MKKAPMPVSNQTLLDNPIWSALTTEQRSIATANELAAKFPSSIGPLAGMRDQSRAAYAALGELAAEETVALFLDREPEPPQDWETVNRDMMFQMMYVGAAPGIETPTIEDARVRSLTLEDVPEMLALTALMEPGPFRGKTIELGGYVGVFQDGRLAAMAGKRLHMTGFTEVSAVCTHPDFQRKGFGKRCVMAVVSDICTRGETAMLHVRCTNQGAVGLYKSLGFTRRRLLHLLVLRPGLR